jgi:hypothetical protein
MSGELAGNHPLGRRITLAAIGLTVERFGTEADKRLIVDRAITATAVCPVRGRRQPGSIAATIVL